MRADEYIVEKLLQTERQLDELKDDYMNMQEFYRRNNILINKLKNKFKIITYNASNLKRIDCVATNRIFAYNDEEIYKLIIELLELKEETNNEQ